MNVEIWTKASKFPEKEYINGIFVAVWGDPQASDNCIMKLEVKLQMANN
jgi:hypothetical protein